MLHYIDKIKTKRILKHKLHRKKYESVSVKITKRLVCVKLIIKKSIEKH